MSRTRPLTELQTLDLQLAQVAARLERIAATLGEDQTVAAARAELAAAEAAGDTATRALRAAEEERRAAADHVRLEEATLYGGRVTAPKELQNLQREVDALKRRLGDCDDRALEHMLARDTAIQRLDAARSALTAAEQASASRNQTLGTEQAKLVRAQRKLTAARDKAVATVPAADLALYDRLRAQRAGRAMAALQDEHCGACGMQVLRHVAGQVTSDTVLVQCSHCGRILYA